MILWGEISEFPLFSLLQFLAGQRWTGVLEIQDFEELGAVYLVRGRIEAVGMAAWDEMLSARLVAAGVLTEAKAKESLMEYSVSDTLRPVPSFLLEKAQGDRRILVDVVNRHISDVIVQLMYWNSGTFRLTTPDDPIFFPVVPSLDVESFLLDAYRRVDEGERPWRDKISGEQELCLTCTIECTPEIKGRYLKRDVCLWRSMPSVLKDPIYRTLQKRPRPITEEDEMEELPFI
ncbi:MAG: hypothetical protein A2133_01255 [Actinobacteria bacterium RBG_16_64_13]|nr:MAG: hypothetical protein A2133_01255 [Actinobacteria bacterium RBG_16_64_13]